VDYLIAGTVWPTISKPGSESLLGPQALAEIVRRSNVPILAIGGVSMARLAAVAASGAAGVAAIGLFMGEGDAPSDCRAVSLSEIVQIARLRFDTPEGAS
jgi:thiamine monophosphate synthase